MKLRFEYKDLSYLVFAGLTLFTSCVRESVNPVKTPATLSATSAVVSLNPLAGTPPSFPVPIAVVSTIPGNGSTNLLQPSAVAADGAGNIYIADQGNNQIKKISATGALQASFGTIKAGYKDGTPANASFNMPSGVAVGPDGRVYVADRGNHRIRVISADGSQVTTLAGSGNAHFNDGQGTIASFNLPTGIAVDANGEVYVADFGNNMVRRISPTGGVTRWAGQPTAGSLDSTGSLASFNGPAGICISSTGTVYVADMNNNKIRQIRSGTVVTLAGNAANTAGSNDGKGSTAKFNAPAGVAVDAAGNVYVAEKTGNITRLITPTGVVTTLAGESTAGFVNSFGSQAQFSGPAGIIIDHSGNIYIADPGNNAIRKMAYTQGVKTFVGSGIPVFNPGTGTGASINPPRSIAAGPNGIVYTSDEKGRIIQVAADGTVSTFAGGTGIIGFVDGPALQARFGSNPKVAVAPDGTVYVADLNNNCIRKIAGGIVSTFAGSGQFTDVDGTGTAASFKEPNGIAFDASGNLYVYTAFSGRLCRITPSGVVQTVNHLTVDPTTGQIPQINSIALDGSGNRYVLSVSLSTTFEFTGDNQPEIKALVPANSIGGPTAITSGTGNFIYLGTQAGQLFKVTPINGGASLTAVAGAGAGDLDGPSRQALLEPTTGMSLGSNGILYFIDAQTNKIRMVNNSITN